METGNNVDEERAEKARHIWKIFVLLYVLTAIGFIFYWAFTNTGLPNLVCELQGRIFDNSCYIAFNILIPILAALVPVFIIKFILEKSMGFSLNSTGDKKSLF